MPSEDRVFDASLDPNILKTPEREPLEKPIVVLVDATDPDNMALAIAARRIFGKNVTVCLSPRIASKDKTGKLKRADLNDDDIQFSREMHLFNARRMKKHLIAAGFDDVPVYLGIDIENVTSLKSLIPNELHVNEQTYDVIDKNLTIDGNFEDLKTVLASHQGPYVGLVGGQFTDIDALLQSGIEFSTLIAQGGFQLKDSLMTSLSSGVQLPFNMELDREAAIRVFNTFKGDLITISSTFTRNRNASYTGYEEMRQANFLESLVELYKRHHEKAHGDINRPLSPHDVHLALIYASRNISFRDGEPLYRLKRFLKAKDGDDGHGDRWEVTEFQHIEIKSLLSKLLGVNYQEEPTDDETTAQFQIQFYNEYGIYDTDGISIVSASTLSEAIHALQGKNFGNNLIVLPELITIAHVPDDEPLNEVDVKQSLHSIRELTKENPDATFIVGSPEFPSTLGNMPHNSAYVIKNGEVISIIRKKVDAFDVSEELLVDPYQPVQIVNGDTAVLISMDALAAMLSFKEQIAIGLTAELIDSKVKNVVIPSFWGVGMNVDTLIDPSNPQADINAYYQDMLYKVIVALFRKYPRVEQVIVSDRAALTSSVENRVASQPMSVIATR